MNNHEYLIVYMVETKRAQAHVYVLAAVFVSFSDLFLLHGKLHMP